MLEAVHGKHLLLDSFRGGTAQNRPDFRGLENGMVLSIFSMTVITYITGNGSVWVRLGLRLGVERTTFCAHEAASKPAPDWVDDILIGTATLPERARVIGDTEHDMAMAPVLMPWV